MLNQILTTALGFFLLVVLLKKFFWSAILKMLDQRRAYIEEELRQTAQRKTEMTRLQEEYQRRLVKIEEEARAKIQQAILDGKRMSVEIQEQARAQGSALVTKAKETIELELAKAKVTLRDQMVEMTVDAVERILRRKLDEKADRQLVDAVLAELEQDHTRA